MADFDSNYWGGGAYTPTDYSSAQAAPNWQPTAMDWSGNYQQPTYYDQYAGYAPDWGTPAYASSDYTPSYATSGGESGGGISSILGGIGDWLGKPSGAEGSATNGSKLLSSAITGGAGALMGIMQSKALEKANKKKAKQDAERIANAGKVAAQQRADYLNGLRQDPNFRSFTVNAPERQVTGISGDMSGYGQTGGEHQFFDPAYLSKITTTPNNYAEGGLALANRPQMAMQPPKPDLGEYVRYLMNGQRSPQDMQQGTMQPAMAHGGLSRMVTGEGGGQDDKVDARLSPGEYVFDADTVSALGDGSSEAGASALDKMRQNIRKHKRAAPVSKIPPKAKKPEGYL